MCDYEELKDEVKAELREELKDEVKAELREELKDEVKAELREEFDELQERVEELEDTPAIEYCDDKSPSELTVDGYPLGAKVSNAVTKMDLETLVPQILEEQTDGDLSALQAAEEQEVDLPPIQEIARLPETQAQEHLSANDLRARFIWRDFTEYSSRCPNGRTIDAGDMRRILQAAEPIVEDSQETRIESKTVKRVMERIVKYTRGVAKIRHSGRSRTLYVPNDWRDQATDAEADVSVSPTSG